MQKELYFDISKEDSGGSLYKMKNDSGVDSFYYNHSTYNDDSDEIKVFESTFPNFLSFWNLLTKDPLWYYQHPLFVHPEQREFVRGKLALVNWAVHPDKKWQESHQRQWKKVLSDPGTYYAS